jgi:hypothetical protein
MIEITVDEARLETAAGTEEETNWPPVWQREEPGEELPNCFFGAYEPDDLLPPEFY